MSNRQAGGPHFCDARLCAAGNAKAHTRLIDKRQSVEGFAEAV
jgi:hypothetical protein